MIWFWLIAAVVFAVVEISTTAMVSVWFSVGALAGLAAALFHGALFVQLLCFAVVSAIALAAFRPLARKVSAPQAVATNADRVLGQEARVTEDIDNDGPTGAVYIDGKTWSARSAGGEPIPAGTMVRVERMEGVKLFVCPVLAQTPAAGA